MITLSTEWWRKRLLMFFIVFVGLLAGTARAAVIFDQPTGPNSNFLNISSTLDNHGTPAGFRVADNFSIMSATVVTDINWWGKPNSGDNNFTFSFYADDGGAPGTVLLATSGSLLTSPVSVGNSFDPLVLYSSTLTAPFAVSAGATYWLSIFNGAADASWLWLSADTPGDGSLVERNDGSLPWTNLLTPQSADLAFQLIRTPVPEPATFALFIVGIGGVAYALRKRRKGLHSA
ncbi:MAG TPA: choice-of-anchor R domain-containing protein [Burkholderiales bacterium]|nr:choice-of-anchor R domain-containing protein [Burkholderiales bacterium]